MGNPSSCSSEYSNPIEDVAIVCDEQFRDANFTKNFSKTVRNGFKLRDNINNDQFANKKDNLLDAYISLHLKGEIDGAKQLHTKTKN